MENEVEVVEEMSLPGRLLRVLFAPQGAFTALKPRCTWADWAVPAIIVAVVAMISTFLTFPIITKEQMAEQWKRIEENPTMTAEQKAQAMEAMGKMQGVGRVAGLVGVPVGVAAGLFVQAAVFLLGLNFLLGSRGTYRELLAITGYSMIPAIPELIVKTPLIIAKGTMKVFTGLGLLLPPDGEMGFLSRVLSSVDLFTVWQMALVSIGIGTLYAMPVKRAGGMVFAFWVIWILISATLRGFAGGFMGG
jgi:hypothetical protein